MRVASRLLIGLTALLLLPSASMSARPPLWPDDMTLGNPQAKVVVVEYASLACPSCARFHNDVFPAFKAKYVDTGKVQFVYREFITAPAQVAVAGAIVARCAGKPGYFKVIEGVFASQQEIYSDGTVAGMRRILFREGGKAGLTQPQVEACLADADAFAAMDARVERAKAEEGVEGTPTFKVNGVRVRTPPTGSIDLPALDAAIAAAQQP
jgi:protein-disulfide isomerase